MKFNYTHPAAEALNNPDQKLYFCSATQFYPSPFKDTTEQWVGIIRRAKAKAETSRLEIQRSAESSRLEAERQLRNLGDGTFSHNHAPYVLPPEDGLIWSISSAELVEIPELNIPSRALD